MKTQAGLTLIEVLIAGLLLSMALGIAAVVFQQNDLQQRQAERLLLRASQLETVISRIRYELGQGARRGEWSLAGVDYAWQATVVKSAAIAGSYDVESGQITGSGREQTLFQIDVSQTSVSVYSFQLTL